MLVLCEGAEEVVMAALHMGQFCFIFSHGSTHFLWNSCLKDEQWKVLVNDSKAYWCLPCSVPT